MKKLIIASLIISMVLCGCSAAGTKTDSSNETASKTSSAVFETSSEVISSSSPESDSVSENASSLQDSEASSSEPSEKEASSQESFSDKQTEISSNEQSESSSDEQSETSSNEQSESSSNEQSETSSNEQSETNEDVYAGTYAEEVAGRGVIKVTKGEGYTYNVHISWPNGSAEVGEWDLSGEFNGRALMQYDNCQKTVITYNADGSESYEIAYTNGTGYLQMREKDADTIGIIWNDDMENVADDAFFVKQ